MFKIQCVVIKKINNNDLQKSTNWIVENGFKLNKVNETESSFRFRQINPEELRRYGYNHYINKSISNDVSLILAYKNDL